jgi:UDP-glucose 4-epimerase
MGSYAGIIPIATKKIIEETEIEVYGDGEQTRDFIFVRDTSASIADIYCKNPDVNCINLATGVETSINTLISLISEILQLPARVKYLPPRPGDVRQHRAGTALLEKVLGYVPKPLNISDLTETINWYRGRIK